MATASKIQKKPPHPKRDDNEFSFRELLLKSLNYLPLFAVFLAVSLTIAVVYIHFQTPVYTTSIKLLLKDINNKSTQTTTVSDQVLPQVFFSSKTNLANETEILRSQTLMQRVVLHQQLNTIYYSIGKVNTLELFDTNPASKFVQFSAVKDSGRSYNVTIKVKEDRTILCALRG